jgi:toxin ParE1/3/4
VRGSYVVRPKADQDLADQAYYLATEAGPKIGHRFLVAAHKTFALLASQPEMGWQARLTHPDLATMRVFRIPGYTRLVVLYKPRPSGVEILRVLHGSRNLHALIVREGVE